MHLGKALAQAAAFGKPESFDKFRERVPQGWIEQALAIKEGVATMRRRRLPAVQVIWLVLAMALFRNRPIFEVVDKLNLALPDPRRPSVAPSAIVQARARLGDEPMKWLFERSAEEWAHESADKRRWRGLALYGVDGTSLRVPDSEENRLHFGGHSGGAKRGDSGYPLVRVVGLMALRSHVLAAVCFGPYATGEVTYAKELWAEVPDNSLVIEDRGFLNAGALIPVASQGVNRHWLTRAKKNTRWTVVKNLAPGDDLVEMRVSSQARKLDPTLPKTWLVRAIRYQRDGFQPQTLLTSMLDASAYPAKEIILLYHERWELELGYDEVKTEMLDREEAIRSKSPTSVNQELWGLFMAYNLVRLEMERVADEADVEPTRISFVAALRMIQDEMLWDANASPGAIPKHLKRLRVDLKRFILPPRRRERVYPRTVKIKMSNYAKKRRNPVAAVAI